MPGFKNQHVYHPQQDPGNITEKWTDRLEELEDGKECWEALSSTCDVVNVILTAAMTTCKGLVHTKSKAGK